MARLEARQPDRGTCAEPPNQPFAHAALDLHLLSQDSTT